MEWATEEAQRCTGCGLPRDQSMRDKGDADFEVVVRKCHACEVKRARAARWKGDDLASHYFGVIDTNPPD